MNKLRALGIAVVFVVMVPGICFTQTTNAVGLHDVVVYGPGIHDRGLPKPLFNEIKAQYGNDSVEGQTIEIPPSVHVHRYYYSGDKEIQGPVITGGPTLVVAKHPATGQQMYVEVTLPSGAPKIAYNKKGITYVFPKRRVGVKFCNSRLLGKRAVVKYQSGQGLHRKFRDKISSGVQKIKTHCQNSQTVEALKNAHKKTRDSLCTIADNTCKATKQLKDSVEAVISIVPGVKPLLNPKTDTTTQRYRNQVKTAAARAKRKSAQFVPTIR